jgi:hypothetical protein
MTAALRAADDNVVESFDVAKDGSHLMLPVAVGDTNCQFVLDTGCDVSAFDNSLEGALKRKPLSITFTVQNGSVASTHFDTFKCLNVTVGRSKLPFGNRSVCKDLSVIRDSTDRDIRGLVGMEFLAEHVVEIDFDAGRVSFLRNADNAVGEKIAMGCGPRQCPMVEGHIPDAGYVAFLIDTGHSAPNVDGLLLPATLEELARRGNFAISKKKYRAVGNDGRRDSRIGTLAEVYFTNLRHFSQTFGEGPANGLGLRYLSQFKVTFDFPNRWLYLAKRLPTDQTTRTQE